MVWIDWETQMVVNTIIEGGELRSLWIIVNVLLNLLGVELVCLVVGGESSVGSVVHFVSALSEGSNVIKSFSLSA